MAGVFPPSSPSAPSPPASTWLNLPSVFKLSSADLKVSFRLFSRIHPSLSHSGSSGLAMLSREVCSRRKPTITDICARQWERQRASARPGRSRPTLTVPGYGQPGLLVWGAALRGPVPKGPLHVPHQCRCLPGGFDASLAAVHGMSTKQAGCATTSLATTRLVLTKYFDFALTLMCLVSILS